MATFILYGNYSPDAVKSMSPKRTDKSIEIIKKYGGSVQLMYATLGVNDMVFILDFPDNTSATKASVALSRMSGVSFTTSPAMPIDDFDSILDEI